MLAIYYDNPQLTAQQKADKAFFAERPPTQWIMRRQPSEEEKIRAALTGSEPPTIAWVLRYEGADYYPVCALSGRVYKGGPVVVGPGDLPASMRPPGFTNPNV